MKIFIHFLGGVLFLIPYLSYAQNSEASFGDLFDSIEILLDDDKYDEALKNARQALKSWNSQFSW